jgi:hypothetical protein
MRRRNALKGQILILIILVVIGLILIFAVSSLLSSRRRNAPVVQDAFWRVGDQTVTTARVGQDAEAHVVVRATEEYVGSIVVKIRKDVHLWSDSDYHMQTFPVNIRGGESEDLTVSFTPDQASVEGFRGLNGYFIQVDFQATGTTWTMENTYPPRLTVVTIPQDLHPL